MIDQIETSELMREDVCSVTTFKKNEGEEEEENMYKVIWLMMIKC